MTRRDTATAELFAVPQPAAPAPASMDFRATVAQLLAQMFAESGLDRWEIAARASRLAGKEISKYMLDSYTAESRDACNAPAWSIPVFETVCNSTLVSNWLASLRGGRLFVGRDALTAELGRIEGQRDELADKVRSLKDTLRRTR